MDSAAEERDGVIARRREDSEAMAGDELQPAADVDREQIRPRIPRELPILPVRNIVVFPGTVVPLNIGRSKSKLLIDAVLAGDKMVALFTQRREDVEDPGIDDVYRVGTAAQVLKLLRMPDGSSSLLVHGLVRVGLVEFTASEPYWKATVNPHEDAYKSNIEIEALAHNARSAAEEILQLSPNVPDESRMVLANIERADTLADFLAANLSLGVVQKQELLETFELAERLRKINATLNNQLEVLRLSQKIQQDVRREIDKSQREYYLHEQMKAIQKELGETDTRASELQDLRKRIEDAGMPENVLKEARRELERLERIPAASPETGIIRDYLTWLGEMPWNKATPDKIDLNEAARILDEDHYGLKKVKRRILEYLAVRKLNPAGRGPILCFVGPPGVGKTSLGQSIARALGREFIRMALGGVRDEADIRGHRRTYIGAIPGRIVQQLRAVGVNNPVMMLDELDKLGADFRGDPAAALLEVLDPAQNNSFTDHYLGVPFDLSSVLFIGTANIIEPVPPALRDRMEVIDLPGYTTAEKLEIAQRYLVPRQIAENGLRERGVAFSSEALRTVIEHYTREAGVRNLERSIGSVCRGLAAKVAREQRADLTVEPPDLHEYLGPPRFQPETALQAGVTGVATGLAYTPVGGEIIFVEAAAMPGRGSFQLTGQIGDIMRESGLAALSLLRARAARWNIELPDLGKTDIHIHVPAGGVPKDGPSAGVAMLTALVSLFSRTPVDPAVGMTGEITLRGMVLPIGGVKEKVMAAHRAGLKRVALPTRNKADLDDVPRQVCQELKFVYADRVEQVMTAAFPGREFPDAPAKADVPAPGVSAAARSRSKAASAASASGNSRKRTGRTRRATRPAR